MKEFVTAAKDATTPEDERPPLEYKVDGEMITVHHPGAGQITLLMALTTSHTSVEESVAGVIDFYFSCLDESDHPHIYRKLMDRHDPFGPEQMQEQMKWWMEEWAGRPTVSSSGSTSSPPSGGPKSRRRTPALT